MTDIDLAPQTAAQPGAGVPYQLPAFVGGDLDQSIGLAQPIAPGQVPSLDVGQLAPPAPPAALIAGLPDGPPVPTAAVAPSPENQLEAPHPPTEDEKLDWEAGRQRALIDKDPAAWATENAKREEDKQKAANDEEALIRARDVKTQLDDMHMQEEAAAKAKQDSEADYLHAQQLHVDSGHWWQTRTTGQKVASYIAAIAGGFLAPYQGGKNSGLDAINDAINRDIDVQTKNIGSQREALAMHQNMVGQAYERTRDIARARETARLAMLQGAQEQINKARAKVDPLGSQAQPLVAAGLGVQNAIAQQQQAMHDKNFAQSIQAGDLQTKQANALETGRHNRAEESNTRAAAGRAAGDKADTLAREQEKDLRVRAVKGFDGKPLMRDSDGGKAVPVYAKDEKAAEVIDTSTSATRGYLEKSKELRKLIGDEGGIIKESYDKLRGGNARQQRIASLAADMVDDQLEARGYKRKTGEDVEEAAEQHGAVSPTALLNTAIPGLIQQEHNMVTNHRNRVQQLSDYGSGDMKLPDGLDAGDIGDPLRAPGAPATDSPNVPGGRDWSTD